MKKIITAVALATVATGAWAQVPELGDVLGDLSTTELDAFNDSLAGEDTIMMDDFEGSLNIAIIDQALDEGFITADEAADVEAALAIIDDNAEFFDFDLLALVEELLAEGVVTTDELYTTLDLFNSLSVADKTIVGQESFSPYTFNIPETVAGGILDRSNYSITQSNPGMSDSGYATIISDGAFAASTYEDDLDAIHAENVTELFNSCAGSCSDATAIANAYNALP